MDENTEEPPARPAIWHVVIDGERRGPLTIDQVSQLAADGILTANSLAWKKEMANWLPAGQVAELQGLISSQRKMTEADIKILGQKAGQVVGVVSQLAAGKVRRAADVYQASSPDGKLRIWGIAISSALLMGTLIATQYFWPQGKLTFAAGALIILIWFGVYLFALITAVASISIRLTGKAVVLRRITVDAAGENGVFAHLTGRATGFIGWILTVCRMDTDTDLIIGVNDVQCVESGIAGRICLTVPLTQVASVLCGYNNSLGLLLLGSMGMIGAVVMEGLGIGAGHVNIFSFIVFAGALSFLALFFVHKRLAITLLTTGGQRIGMTFQRGYIENTKVDIDQVMEMAEVIRSCVNKAQSLQSLRN